MIRPTSEAFLFSSCWKWLSHQQQLCCVVFIVSATHCTWRRAADNHPTLNEPSVYVNGSDHSLVRAGLAVLLLLSYSCNFLIGSRGAQQRNIPPGSTRLFDKAQKAKHNIYNINQFNSILKKRRSEQFWNIKYIQYQLHRLQSCQSTCVLVLTYDVIHMCTHHISEVLL